MRDILAGLVGAIVALPDGLATAALIGVNPIYGLYANAIAPPVAGLIAHNRRMIVASTGASAIIAATAISGYAPEQRGPALFLMVMMTGLILIVLGLLKAGRLVKFVSHAVMTGFMLCVAMALILDQLPSFLGFAGGSGKGIIQAGMILLHPHQIHLQSALTGGLALALMLGLRGTRLRPISPLLALVLPMAFAAALGWSDVAKVGDAQTITGGFPFPALPDVGLFSFDLLGSAAVVAIIISIQGAGIAHGLALEGGRSPDVSRDMIAQGTANCASSVFSGIVVGGSVGQTTLNIALGAHSRLAALVTGGAVLAFLLLIPHLVALVPVPVLAALMISAGVSALDFREAFAIWQVGGSARWAIAATFVTGLLSSIQIAVGFGMLLTIGYFILSSATDVSVRMLEDTPDGEVQMVDPPETLPGKAVVVLEVFGSLFFAGARTLEERLPRITGAAQPIVILRLRGHSYAGATLMRVLDTYARKLREVGGALYLSGVDPKLHGVFMSTDKLAKDGVHIFASSPVLGRSTKQAALEAHRWLGA